jgi:O-acetylhomoserine/O-acetylserine sulfhydrylase-like pyridoxal-dependent enzyme
LYYLPRVVLVLIATLIPVFTPFSPLLWFLFGAWMMAIQYGDYPMDNNGVTFRRLKSNLKQRRITSMGFGALISFDLGSLEAAEAFLGAVRLCSLGESLGGVETLISHPATMTHAGYTQPERDALGITHGLVRISVGCEDADDLVADLEQALGRV